jgi:phage tail sheath protein FI
MPATLTYPGVYIEEIPSGVRTITGVSTSVAAFLDYFRRGPVNRAVRVFSLGDFNREFGGLDANSEASYAIQQFFLNGGAEAWVVRVVTTGDAIAANNATAADVHVGSAIGAAADALVITAISQGAWGNSLRAIVDQHGTAGGEFNLTIAEEASVGGRPSVVRSEVFRNLSMDATRVNSVTRVVNSDLAGSKLVRVVATGATAPLANGAAAAAISGTLAAPVTIPAASTLSVSISDGFTATTKTVAPTAGNLALAAIATDLQTKLQQADPTNPAFAGATVAVVGTQLRITAGGTTANSVSFAGTAVAALKLDTAGGVTAELREYVLGGGTIANTAQRSGGTGQDGTLPGSTALIGDPAAKTGINALEDVDLFNILCIPRAAQVSGTSALTGTQAAAVLAAAESYCEKRRAFFVMDTPSNISDGAGITAWLNANGSLRHRNAALYFPRVNIPDPLDDFRLRSIGACGTVAGLYAQTDSTRGVWKAPAGTEAVARNVSELGDTLTDQENGALNPLAINCLRNFPAYGNVVWGSRTLDGSDQAASEWKYIPVRRTALFIEESLYRGTQWAVFEPNDEPLWAQIRLNLGAFMHNLFRQGAFQGSTPRDAYFVKCDKETTTQNDINLGIVNIVVGFAPLKPAEFVVIKLQQMAGQIAT